MAYYGLMYKCFSHSLLNVKQQIILVIYISLVLYNIPHVYYETLMMQPIMNDIDKGYKTFNCHQISSECFVI